MKVRFVLVIFLVVCMELFSQTGINVLTWNLRYDNPADGVNAWGNRKQDVKALILFNQADLVCTQEGLKSQLDYLQDSLGGYSYFGVGRDDGKEKGEYTAIFYRTSRFEIKDQGTFWLSETPEIISKGWDAAIVRICTWGKLLDHKTGKMFFIFNTHFDHIGETARQNSARLIVEKTKELDKEGLPLIVTGDFNSTPEMGGYKVLSATFSDSRMVSEQPAFGPLATFNAFRFDQEPKERIDYVFVGPGISVKRYAVLTNSREQRYPSDHFPVFSELNINE